jgi:hypothetical protein
MGLNLLLCVPLPCSRWMFLDLLNIISASKTDGGYYRNASEVILYFFASNDTYLTL